MIATLGPLGALFAGVALLLVGSGLLGTLLGIRGSLEGYDDQVLGLIMSGYFVGFFLGTFIAPAGVRRMGHSRAFSFYAAVFAGTVLLHPILVHPLGWGLLRVATGIAVVGLYTVIESWLNASVEGAERGRVFAIYMVINLLALALGQQLLRVAPADSFVLFSLAAIMVCAAVLPVAATRMAQPAMHAARRMGVWRTFRIAPAAAVGALASGITLGAFWGLAPVYAARVGLGTGSIATFMTVAIIGGAVLQWPIGRLSDAGDRRRTLALVSAGAAIVAGLLLPFTAPPLVILHAAIFLYGGLAFAIYPVAIAHLLDHVPREDVLPACSTVLLLHGVGAAFGPATAGAAMAQFGPKAFPGFLLCLHALAAVYVLTRLALRPREAPVEGHFHPMVRTTPTAMEMLPEAETRRES